MLRKTIDSINFDFVTVGVIFVLIVLAAGCLGFQASESLFPTPKIGVIHIDWEISYSIQAYFLYPLNYAVEHDEIVAVVLLIDSPGGSASLSEEIFYRILDLRDKKPVVATVDTLGASGSYYIASASNYIYSKPAAFIGSIGVISTLPEGTGPSERTITTGPFKGSGSSQVDWIRGMDVIKETFITNVYDQRLYALENMHTPSRANVLPDKDSIATGQVWIAPIAYDIGLIDAIGSNMEAIQKAADLAHVSNYEIIDLTRLIIYEDPERSMFTTSFDLEFSTLDLTSIFPEELSGGYIETGPWQKYYYLYIPPTE